MLVHRTTCRQADCSPLLVLEFNGNGWNVRKEILCTSISVYLFVIFIKDEHILEIINFVILILI